MEKTELVVTFFDENENARTWPSRTVARKLYEEYPHVFSCIDNARNIVRKVRGSLGVVNRNKSGKHGGKYYNPTISYDMPVSRYDEYEPYKVPDKLNNMLVLCDVHVPFHVQGVVRLIIEYAKNHGVDSVYLNGDFADQYWMSRFVKFGHKHPFTWKDELDAVRQMLDWMMDELPNAKFIYKFGNHEDRFEDYICRRVPEYRGVPDFSLSHLFELKERGFDVVESRQYAMFDSLKIVHFHEFGRGFASNPVNMARSLYLKAKQSALCGHGHTTSEHCETRMDGKIITCWSVGCACDLHPDYSPLGKSNHGFAIVTRDKNGFNVNNRKIYNGKII